MRFFIVFLFSYLLFQIFPIIAAAEQVPDILDKLTIASQPAQLSASVNTCSSMKKKFQPSQTQLELEAQNTRMGMGEIAPDEDPVTRMNAHTPEEMVTYFQLCTTNELRVMRYDCFQKYTDLARLDCWAGLSSENSLKKHVKD